ncbi:MAG TPA: sulfite exporter TauE/SafE family protein [Gemmatimonadaceae bacterium]|nr:sulfite exporter TauE/SafE family protein [Gemmatimonadaceae bacterium]
MLGWGSGWHALIAFGVAVIAGAMNAVAGGGTNLSFPTLIWLGLSPVHANATNAVALWPGSLGGAWGFRREIGGSPRRWLWLVLPSLVGGAIGAYLLVHTPSTFFRAIAPYLVIGSSVLIALEPTIKKHLGGGGDQRQSTGWLVVAGAVDFVIAVYGGYFGAGIGILLLTALGLLGAGSIHQANGLKNVYALAIKGVAVVYFILEGIVVWHAAWLMAVGAIIGGYAGAALCRKVSARTMRGIVVLIGVGMGVAMIVQIA